MISLTYISVAVRKYDRSDLVWLMTQSRERNEAASVSGMLLYAGNHFIQTLEGAAGDVDATYARIEVDTRHRDLVVVLREDIEDRFFPGWSMGCRALTPAEAAATPEMNEFFDPGSDLYKRRSQLGRAGIFHRVFRETAISRV